MEYPETLQQAIQYFSDEQVCIDTFAAMRWPNGPECPECQAKEPYYLKTQKRWKCRSCRRQFSVKLNSVFEDSPIPLQKWLPALWMVVNCKNGISSYELARALGVHQKSAWFMLHRIREAMSATGTFGAKPKIGTPGGSGVEVDETFIGGKFRNMHKDKRARYGNLGGKEGKTIVMGMLDRDLRQVRALLVPNVDRDTLQNAVLKHVKYGSRVFTDEWRGYNGLHYRFVHDFVNHMQEYVRGSVHTQGIENFWSLLKRSLKGTYVAVEPYHLQRYVDEQAFRFNNRATKDNPLNDADRFALALSQVANKRLTFAELTGKTGSQTTDEPF